MEDEDGSPFVECHRQEMIDEYVWSMDILERSILESKKEDLVDEHQSYILEEPQDPRFREKSRESIFPSTNYTYESCNHPMLLFYQILERMVVDALFITSIPKHVVALAQVLTVKTTKVELMT